MDTISSKVILWIGRRNKGFLRQMKVEQLCHQKTCTTRNVERSSSIKNKKVKVCKTLSQIINGQKHETAKSTSEGVIKHSITTKFKGGETGH